MASAGDIDMAHDFFFLPASKNATAAIAKGDIVTLSAGRKFANGDKGPYGVANQAIASGADMKGKVVIDGIVYVAAVASVAIFSAVTPAGGGTQRVSGATGYADSAVGSGFLLGTLCYDASVNAGDLIRIQLAAS